MSDYDHHRHSATRPAKDLIDKMASGPTKTQTEIDQILRERGIGPASVSSTYEAEDLNSKQMFFEDIEKKAEALMKLNLEPGALNYEPKAAPAQAPLTLPTDSQERKEYPLFRGVLAYFPAALAGVAKTSKAGNDKHNPGQELHHARGKSTDHADCIIRHLMDTADFLARLERGQDGGNRENVLNEANQLVWRALAFSQELHERFGSPLAPGAKE